MNDAVDVLQRTLHAEIPLTVHMGLRVTGYDGRVLRLSAPLAPNTNHQSTVFGGTLYSVLVLCGWGLLFLKLREAQLPGHVVIHRSRIDYHAPVQSDFTASAALPEAPAVERFMNLYARRGRARLTLDASVETDGRSAVQFSGDFVVHR